VRAFLHWSGFYSLEADDVPYAHDFDPMLDTIEVRRAR
jgi:hypothetical protein